MKKAVGQAPSSDNDMNIDSEAIIGKQAGAPVLPETVGQAPSSDNDTVKFNRRF